MITQEHGYGLYNLKGGKEIKLAMQSLWLTGQVNSFGARLLVSHVLKSNEMEPIEVVYSFMLPRDGTLRRFYITGDGFSAHSELKPVKQAEKDYERGIEEGRLSALSKIYRDGVVNLNVGNIRPNETITVHLEILAGVESHFNGFRFRFPFTLAPTYHAQAKMILSGDGQGEIELPENDFGDVILPTFMKDSDNLHKIGFNLNINFPHNDIQIASPSHNIQTSYLKDSLTKASLALQEDVPNRDLVLDVHSKIAAVQIHRGIDRMGETSFICTIPSTEFGEVGQESRNFVFLLDRSGSMSGAPLQQAKNALRACISALTEKDGFSLVAFDSDVEVFDELVHGTMDIRNRAEIFLERINARGGTELLHGIKTASAILGCNGGDIMIITDGQVSGTEEIIQHTKSLPIRLHILGIGSASQDRFFCGLARETGGTSKFVTTKERIDLVALELFSGIGRPVATDLKATLIGTKIGRIEPNTASQVYESSSLQILGHFNLHDTPQLILQWKNQDQQKTREYSLNIENNSNGNTLRLIRGSRLITDYENQMTVFSTQRGSVKREEQRTKEWIERISTEYGLSSSQMSLVSVIEREGDQAGKLPKTIVVPVGMPQDVEFDSYFNSPSDILLSVSYSAPKYMLIPPVIKKHERDLCRSVKMDSLEIDYQMSTPKSTTEIDDLMKLAANIEPDGGISGNTIKERISLTISALVKFLKEGNTVNHGPFRTHVKKLVEFMIKHCRLLNDDNKKRVATDAIEQLSEGKLKDGEIEIYAKKIIEILVEL